MRKGQSLAPQGCAFEIIIKRNCTQGHLYLHSDGVGPGTTHTQSINSTLHDRASKASNNATETEAHLSQVGFTHEGGEEGVGVADAI